MFQIAGLKVLACPGVSFGSASYTEPMTDPAFQDPARANPNGTWVYPGAPQPNPGTAQQTNGKQANRPTKVTLTSCIAIPVGLVGAMLWGIPLLVSLLALLIPQRYEPGVSARTLLSSRLAFLALLLVATAIQLCVVAAGVLLFTRRGRKFYIFAAVGKLLVDIVAIVNLAPGAKDPFFDPPPGLFIFSFAVLSWLLLCVSLVLMTRPDAKRWFSKQM